MNPVRIDLAGPDGNTYVLTNLARHLGWQLSYSDQRIERIIEDMRDGDYDHLLNTMEREFPGVEFVFGNDPRRKSNGDTVQPRAPDPRSQCGDGGEA